MAVTKVTTSQQDITIHAIQAITRQTYTGRNAHRYWYSSMKCNMSYTLDMFPASTFHSSQKTVGKVTGTVVGIPHASTARITGKDNLVPALLRQIRWDTLDTRADLRHRLRVFHIYAEIS